MKTFKLYWFSSEAGGMWQKSIVKARNLNQAKRMVSNLYYVPMRFVFEQ